jgi:dihydroorotase
MNLLLKGGRVIDPSQKIDAEMDILVENGKISSIDSTISIREGDANTITTLDCTDFIIVPGLIDMHTHLREPGHEYKETVQSGGNAAITGGFTSIACMPNTNPVNDNRSVTEFILKQARHADTAHIYPVAAISRGSNGTILTEFGDLKNAGAVAFSDDGKPVMNSLLMRSALEYGYSLDMPIISHCEELSLSADGSMNEGFVSTELGLKGIPAISEDIMVQRDIMLAEYTNTSVHIAHVSTAGSVHAIREAKRRGIRVTAETAPHYFTLTEDAVRKFSSNTKVYPPLRSMKDVEAIKEGLKDGTIDVIASDHAPHSSIEKDVEFEYAASGIIGLETSLSLSMKLVEDEIISLNQLIKKMSTTPARILRIRKGTLAAGSDADITVIDPQKTWTVNVNNFKSKSRNCPFHGWNLKGKAVITIVRGTIKYKDL